MTRRTGAGKRRPRPALSIVQPGGGRREQQPNYDRVFAKVEARLNDLLAWISQQSQLALELAETVLQLPEGEPREKKVREMARVEPWSVASALLGGARQRLTGEPAQASSLAELAVAAAEEMDTAPHPPLLKAGLLINAYLLLATSRHRAGQIEAAEEALERAETCLAEASPGPRSRFLCLLRQFRRVQLSFDRTQQSFDSIVALLEERLEAFDV
jgi:hypothetical protein